MKNVVKFITKKVILKYFGTQWNLNQLRIFHLVTKKKNEMEFETFEIFPNRYNLHTH